MNFLRGVMGGQSAGPQHTEAETVRGAAGPGLGKGPGRNGDGGLRGPEVTSRAPPWVHMPPPPLSRNPPSYSLSSLSAAPTHRGVSARLTAAASLSAAGPARGWSVQGAAREGVDPGQGWPDRLPRPSRPRASPGAPPFSLVSPLAEWSLKSGSLSRGPEWGFGGDWV